MLLQLMAYVKAKRAFSRFSQQNKKDHLYEAPEELSPLVLTQNIYGKSFKEMVDSGDAQLINSGITFEQMIQATLLDLIDRKLLGLSKEEGKLQIENLSKEALNKEEALFTEMAFGEKTKVDIERLFAHYQYDKQQIKVLKKKYHGKQLEEMVHQSSEAVLAQIKQKSQAITEAVAETIAQLGLKSPYRPLSHRERIGVRSSQWMGGTGLILLLIVMVFLFIQGSQLAPIYLGLFALEALILLYTAFHLETYMLSGVETQEGAYRVHQWQSFRNIIRDINKFDDVEIEGLVVWNRILVYATLFGYAKKVENYLKVHRIALPEAYHVLNSGNLSYLLYNTTPHFVSTLSSATEASHFTVPSGGSGMSGGGFSGGGGGGGGAF
ncbi:DUF2207 family protein [Streptococcus ictaluri]|nr:DUF2207 domain-containing protein [Streptococcus ictaluri]